MMRLPIFLLLSASLAAPLLAQDQPPEASASFPADFVVSRWIDGIGNQAAMNTVSTLAIDESVVAGNSKPTTEHVIIANQGRFRLDITYPDNRMMAVGFDGQHAWRQSDALGFGLMSAQDLRITLFRESPILALLLSHHYSQARLLNEDSVEGKPCHVYAMSADGTADEIWTSEAATGLVRSIRATGPSDQVVLYFNDYRKVDQLTLPFETAIDSGGTRITTRRSKITLNVPFYPTYFTATPWDLRDAATVDQILSNYIRRAESVESMKSIQSRIVKSTIQTPATGVTSHKSVTILYPNKVLIDTTTTGMGDETEGFNGTAGWESSDLEGFHLLKPAEVPSLFANLSTQADRSIGDEAPLRKIIGERLVQGRKTTAIALSALNGPIGIFYFDQENGRLLRVGSTQQQRATGVPESTIDYSDFRNVDGVETAFVTTLTTATMQVITTIDSIENNVAVDEDTFDPPPQE